MKKCLLLVAACLLMTFALPNSAFAQFFGLGFSPPTDPNRHWKILETDNFEIIYDENQRQLALRAAAEAERAHILLTAVLKTTRAQKTVIVIADITDSANGSATALPRPLIELYPVLPSVNDTVDEYYDWIRELVTHEYAHISNFQPTSGIMDVVRFIFGSIGRPDIYLPRWYAEGLAVEMESRLTPLGRGRSHYFSALDRSFFEAGIWGQETIDEINSPSTPSWPRGQRPYYWGHLLMHSMSETKTLDGKTGGDIFGLLNDKHGARVPFFINGVPKEVFGKNYADLFTQAQDLKKPGLQSQWDKLKNAGAQNGEPIDSTYQGKSYFYTGAQISPDGLKLAAIVRDYNADQAIKVWERKHTGASFTQVIDKPKVITRGKDLHQLSWRSDSDTIVFDKAATYRHFSQRSDLYEVKASLKESQKPRRISTGLRAREAAVLPNGNIVFVQINSSNTALGKMDSSGGHYKILYSPAAGERVSSPRVSQEKIIFSLKDNEGHEEIKSIDFDGTNLRPLTRSEKTGEIHNTPVPKKDGGFFYSGSQSGVLNIYENENGKNRAVTNVTTLATSPEFDPWTNEIIYSRLTSNGFMLESKELREGSSPLPIISSTYNYPPPVERKLEPAKILSDEDYKGLSYLWPQFWVPFVSFVPGGMVFEALVNGADPIYEHQYELSVGFDTRAQQPREALTYVNGNFPFSINATVVNDFEYLAGLSATQHILYGAIGTTHYLQKHENQWSLSPNFSYKMIEYPGIFLTQGGPGISLGYSNIDYPVDDQVSPESGYSFNVGYNYFLPSIGNTNYQSVSTEGVIYLSGKPLPERHVIKLRGAGWYAPQQNTIFAGFQQAGGEYGGLYFDQFFVVRGYPYGEFIGSTIVNANFEYRFPIAKIYAGPGTLPAFTKTFHGALVADAVTLDGGYYQNAGNFVNLIRTPLGNFFAGTGLELKGDFQFFYNWDTTIKFGMYYGFNSSAYGGAIYFLGFSSKL